MKIRNLTPHEVVVFDPSGERELGRVPVCGKVARVQTQVTELGKMEIDGHSVPLVSTKFGEVVDLPPVEEGTINIASILVVQAVASQRNDVIAPDTGPQSVVRDLAGNILGVRRFTR